MIKGINGSVTLAGKFIILHPLNRFDKRGERTIPISSLTTVQFKAAGRLSSGYIEFVTAGNANQSGRVKATDTKTENTITFGWKQNDAFTELRNSILDRM